MQCCPQSMTVDYDFEKLLTYLLDLTEFPPLVYSLRVLFEQSHLSVSGWVCNMHVPNTKYSKGADHSNRSGDCGERLFRARWFDQHSNGLLECG